MKKLYRSKTDRMIAGVCGGLAQYFGIDSNLIRFLFLISIFINGLGIIIYIAALFIVPEEKVEGEEEKSKEKTKEFWQQYKSIKFWGYLFIFAGLLILLKASGLFQFMIFQYLSWGIVLGLLLIALGFYLLYKKDSEETIEQELEKVKRSYYKKSEGKIIAGVCAGLAETLKMDVSLMRILWVLLAIFSSGLFILIYLILAIFLPNAETNQSTENNFDLKNDF